MGAPYALSSDLVSAWPAKSLEVAQYIDGQLPLIAMTQNAQTGTTYSLAATDFTKLVTLSNASPVTVTVPLESSVAWVAGTQLRLMNLGAGVVTVVGAGGVTINGSPLTLAQFKNGTLIKTGTNTWTFLPSGGGGKILQVVSATTTTPVATTSATFVTTGITATITPSSATSKVLISCNTSCRNDLATPAQGVFTIFRGTVAGTNLGNGANGMAMVFASSASDLRIPVALSFLDSPSTTSAQAYTLGMYSGSAGNTITASAFDALSSIILMEVSA